VPPVLVLAFPVVLVPVLFPLVPVMGPGAGC
jgi:hypothetical protein